MKRIIGLTVGLSLSLMPANSATPPKAGSICSKQGIEKTYQGKKFTCIKSGKRLVWNKGVVVLKPKESPSPSPSQSVLPTPTTSPSPSQTPTPTQSPTPTPTPQKAMFTPWATVFETLSMTQAALDATSSYFGTVIPSSDYEITVDPLITSSDRAWITSALNYAMGSFTHIQRDKTKVFLGTSREWSKNTLTAVNLWIGDPSSPYPCSQGLNDAYCVDKNMVLLVYSDIYAPNSQYRWDIGRRSTPAHEIFHTVQNALGGPRVGPESPMWTPRWLREGSANFYGYYVADRLGFDSYQTGRNQQVNTNPAYKTVVPLIQYDNFTSDPYGIGQAASEYLIASIGFEKFLNIWKFTKSESSFSEGFKKATGISLDEFYSKFEVARSSMKIGS